VHHIQQKTDRQRQYIRSDGRCDLCANIRNKKRKKTNKERNLAVVFTQTTHVVGSISNFACRVAFGN